MSKEDIINYVMTTPGNPNRAVLTGMLDDTADTGETGYNCYEEMVTLAEETVTTVKKSEESSFAEGEMTFENLITADTIHVTFNGTEYDCEKVELFGSIFYGAAPTPDGEEFVWSEYPFSFDTTYNIIATQTAGTYQIKIEALVETVEVTDCFKKAVNATSPIIHVNGKGVADKTWQEVHDALVNGTPSRLVYQDYEPSSEKTDSITGVSLIMEAHIITDRKTGNITYEVRGNKRVLVSDTADGYLYFD